MIYDTRNEANLNKLADNTKRAALALYNYAKANKIEILIYDTLRTKQQQAENFKNGSSDTLVSYHLTGQALDFVPVDSEGRCLWAGYNAKHIQAFIRKAKSLGFTWGGDWTKFRDSPHLQFYGRGYGKDTFCKKEIAPPVASVQMTIKTTKKFTSLVDYLKARGVNSSYAGRQMLAARNGIPGYRGTAAQNEKLLNLLQG